MTFIPPRPVTTQLLRVSPEVLAEGRAAKERIRKESEAIFGKPFPMGSAHTFTDAEYLRTYYERHEFTGD